MLFINVVMLNSSVGQPITMSKKLYESQVKQSQSSISNSALNDTVVVICAFIQLS